MLNPVYLVLLAGMNIVALGLFLLLCPTVKIDPSHYFDDANRELSSGRSAKTHESDMFVFDVVKSDIQAAQSESCHLVAYSDRLELLFLILGCANIGGYIFLFVFGMNNNNNG